LIEAVKEFHRKFGYPIGHRLDGPPGIGADCSITLHKVATTLLQLFRENGDLRYYRLHLITEETAELAEALREMNEEETLDALADLLYVVLGTAVTFDLPIEAAFDEVHRSNMTKSPDYRKKRFTKDTDAKGDSYEPPNLQSVLKGARNEDHERTVAGGDPHSS
jgi:phosphoribosyl-ATP pyrophosphohydrolase